MVEPERMELRLLVIEDEALIAMDLQDMLADLGHEVLGVSGTIDHALRLIEDCGDRVDAVLLDANLGGASARPIADLLRERNMRFIVASGYGREELRHLGFDGPSIGKPYRREEIDTALAGLF